VKVSYMVWLTVVCALLAGSGRAEAYVGFGYRANEPVRVDRCYRGLAWNYGVPFYLVRPKHPYASNKCTLPQYRKKNFKG
jgi:hypothetical protein